MSTAGIRSDGAGFGAFTYGGEDKFRFGSDNSGQLAGFRNKIINGGFTIWQRGLTFSLVPAASAYVADRWLITNSTNQTLTVNTNTTPALGKGDAPRLRMSFSVAPSSGEVYLATRLEGVSTLSNGMATLSMLAQNAAGIVGGCYLNQNYGVGGSASVATPAQTLETVLPGVSTKSVKTFALPSTVSKTFGTSNYLELITYWPIRTTDAVAVYEVQLEEGSIATPFENRPIGLELSLCQRYYYRNFPGVNNCIFGIAWCNGTTGAQAVINFPVPMRVAPVALEQSGVAANYSVTVATSIACNSVPTFQSANIFSAVVQFLVAGGLTFGQAAQISGSAASGASAYLGWSAEL